MLKLHAPAIDAQFIEPSRIWSHDRGADGATEPHSGRFRFRISGLLPEGFCEAERAILTSTRAAGL